MLWGSHMAKSTTADLTTGWALLASEGHACDLLTEQLLVFTELVAEETLAELKVTAWLRTVYLSRLSETKKLDDEPRTARTPTVAAVFAQMNHGESAEYDAEWTSFFATFLRCRLQQLFAGDAAKGPDRHSRESQLDPDLQRLLGQCH